MLFLGGFKHGIRQNQVFSVDIENFDFTRILKKNVDFSSKLGISDIREFFAKRKI